MELSGFDTCDFVVYTFKDYLRNKSIFCHKVVLDVQLINFFIWRKNVLFSRYLNFCVFMKFTNFKIFDVITALLHNVSYTFAYFFGILSTIKMKCSQILVYLKTNISNMFLAQCQRLETRSRRHFYDFNEMAL